MALRGAGGTPRAGFANVVAAELFDRALAAADALESGPRRGRRRVAEALGDVCERFGDYGRARAGYERALRLLPDDPVVETRLAAKRGVLPERLGEFAEASRSTSTGSRASASCRPTRSSENRAELEIGAAGVRFRQGRFQDAFAGPVAAAQPERQATAAGSRTRTT